MIGIAILERDPMVRSILEKYMEKIDGYRIVGMTDSVQEVQKMYTSGDVQLLLGEVCLQDGEALEWIRQLRMQGEPLDCIAVTGTRSYAAFQALMQFGAVDYILKPFTYARFREGLIRYRIYKEDLTPESELEQEALDDFFFAAAGARKTASNRDLQNFSRHTYEQIYEFAREHSDCSFTAGELADAMGVSRITARRYLELMEREKILEVELQYGKVGRPKNRYRYRGQE